MKSSVQIAIRLSDDKRHCWNVVHQSHLEVKVYSNCSESRKVSEQPGLEVVVFESITGFVIVVYDNKWYLAVTLQTFPSTEEVKVSCLEPAGPAASFVYPRTPDILTIPAIDILTLVDPVTNSTGRCYRLSDTESSKASRVLQLRLSTS